MEMMASINCNRPEKLAMGQAQCEDFPGAVSVIPHNTIESHCYHPKSRLVEVRKFDKIIQLIW